MSRQKFRDLINFYLGFILDRPVIDDQSVDYAAEGSSNVLFLGEGEPVPFKGLTLVSGVGGIYYSGPNGFALGPVFTLTVSSQDPSSGVSITVSPTDLEGNTNGST